MELKAAGLLEQPFQIHGKPLVFVSYEAQLGAHAFLNDIYNYPTGLGLLQGPALSGKSTLIQAFVDSLPSESDVAVVDGTGLDDTALLESVLNQFGYKLKFNSVNELINMVKVFVLQRTASRHAPLIIIENAQHLGENAIRVLHQLITLKVKHFSALRLVLLSDLPLESVLNAPKLSTLVSRLTGQFELGAMAQFETTDYVHEKLKAGGCTDPESVIPEDVCNEIFTASGGWPGIVDRLVLLAFAKAKAGPLEKEHIAHPTMPEFGGTAILAPVADDPEQRSTTEACFSSLFVSKDGETLSDVTMDKPRLIIGRAKHNDLSIESKYISRHHAMLVRDENVTLLMDLNSTNGTYVNSCRISNQVLVNNDVISIGQHRIKFIQPDAMDATDFDAAWLQETVILKNFQDIRRMLVQENTQSMPIPPLMDVSELDG